MHPAPERLAVLALRLENRLELHILVLPHLQQRPMLFLVEDRERCDDLRKRRAGRARPTGRGTPTSIH
ncbi:hypothetical protein, partial [Microbulbifer sp.]|uniref:hypothetical protein n=1 Tax=Microbulbifer sp. TaxID=1908541 RepID=UPI003F3F8711